MRAALLLVVVALAAVGLVVAAPASSIDKPTTIRVVSSLVSLRQVDGARKGQPDPGDGIVTVSRLRNGAAQFGRKRGIVVGSDRARP